MPRSVEELFESTDVESRRTYPLAAWLTLSLVLGTAVLVLQRRRISSFWLVGATTVASGLSAIIVSNLMMPFDVARISTPLVLITYVAVILTIAESVRILGRAGQELDGQKGKGKAPYE